MPSSLSVHFAGAWRTATGVYCHYAGAWRTVQNGWRNIGGTWYKVFVNAVITAPAGTVSHSSSSSASAGISMRTDGTVETNVANIPSSLTNWYAPTLAGTGNNYWVRATLAGGQTPSSGTLGIWLQLSIARSWSNFTSGAQVRTSDLTMEVSSDAGGVVILSTGSLTLYAESGGI